MLSAKQEAENGTEALKACQFSTAAMHFSTANELYSNHEEILLALAVSEIFSLTEIPEIQTLASKLGYQISLQSMCDTLNHENNNDSNISQDAELPNEKCFAFSELFDTTGQEDIKDEDNSHSNDKTPFYTQIDPELTFQEAFQKLHLYLPVLKSASEHLTEAAQLMDSTYEIKDILGYHKLNIHPADIATLAMIINLMMTAVEVAVAYPMHYSIQQAVMIIEQNDNTSTANWINQHLLVSTYQPSSETAAYSFGTLLDNLKIALPHIKYLQETQEISDNPCQRASLLNWTNLHPAMIMDLEKLANTPQGTTLVLDDFFDLPVSLDTYHLFTHLPWRHAQTSIVVTSDTPNNDLVWNFQDIIQQINTAFQPPIFENKPSVDFKRDYGIRIQTAWLNWNPVDLL